MKAFRERDAADDKTRVEFSKLHRMSLLATPCLLFVMVAGVLVDQPWVFYWVFFNGIYLALVIGVISSLGVIHAVLILFDAPERRIMRNVVPTLMVAGSLLFFVVALPGVGPQ